MGFVDSVSMQLRFEQLILVGAGRLDEFVGTGQVDTGMP